MLNEKCERGKCSLVLGKMLNAAFVLPTSMDAFLPSGTILLWMGKRGGELSPALQSWEDSAHSHYLALGHHNRKFGQAQLQLLTFHLELQFSLEWDGAKVKRQSLDCVTKVLFKGDCMSQIRGSLVFPLSLQEVNTVHGLRQQSRRVALHPFPRMHLARSRLCKDQILN